MEHLPKITCQAIPHKEQDYDTIGDYKETDDGWLFTVSQMRADSEFLVFVHELVEWYLVLKKGISNKDIVAFDKKFKKEQVEGLHPDIDEPGNSPDCPYKDEHFFAANIERILADKLGLDWEEHDRIQSAGSPFRE